MDEVEKWLVDQAQARAGEELRFVSDVLESTASLWHEEGATVLARQYKGYEEQYARLNTALAVSESQRDLDKTRIEELEAQNVRLMGDNTAYREEVRTLRADRDEWRRLANESVQEHIALKEQWRQEYPEPSWPLENQQQRKPRTIGWMVSEIYAAVKRVERTMTAAEAARVAQEDKVEYSGLEAEMALSGELFTRRRSEEDWQVLIAQVNDLTRQRDELTEMVRTPTMAITNEPNLGLATTEEMMRELITRFRMEQYVDSVSTSAYAAVDRAIALAEMLGGMDAHEREYRTVDHG
jgi:hypothetical protein